MLESSIISFNLMYNIILNLDTEYRIQNCVSSTNPNTCWTKNSWSSGIMSIFLGQFLVVKFVLGETGYVVTTSTKFA